MSRIVWLIALAGLSSVACSSSGDVDTTQPVPEANDTPVPDDSDRGDGSEGDRGEPGSSYFSDGPDGVSLEVSNGEGSSSYRCTTVCADMCSDCLFEACMATSPNPDTCFRSREACTEGCGLCPQGGTAIACYAPCLKGEPSCYANLGLVIPDDEARPDVTSPRDESLGEQSRPDDEAQPANDATPSSSSSRGNSGRPADG